MKVIFNYTIPHTGTHFLMDMLRQGYDIEKWCQVDDEWFGNRFKDGILFENCPLYYGQGHPLWLMVGSVARQEDKQNKVCVAKNDNLLLVKGHHWHRGSLLEKYLKEDNFNSIIKFISPLRDPFLSIMTRSWQGYYNDGRNVSDSFRQKEERLKEARRITETFVDILTIKKDRIFTFPIDGDKSKTKEDRLSLAKQLFDFCNLEFTKEANEYVLNWNPVNTSKSKSHGADQDKRYKDIFQRMKSEYLSGNIDFIEKNNFCNIEFNFLRKERYLKDLLKEAGYSSLPWY